MNAELARAILAQGKKDGTHEQPIPEDDAKAIADAEELVGMAQTAWDQHVRGPEVEILLKMAAEAENGGPPPSGEEPDSPEPESAQDEEPSEPPSEPEAEPSEPSAPADPDLLDVEPWENFAHESVATVISGIDAALNEYSADDFRDLMGHVWAYEQEHKNRATVLDHLERVARKLNRRAEEASQASQPSQEQAPETPETHDQTQPESEPTPPPEPASEAETPAEDEDTGMVDDLGPVPEAPTDEELAETEAESDNVVDLPPRKPQPSEQEQDQENDYIELVKLIESQLAEERVHKPEPPTEKVPDLPWDWTKMSDADLQRFHGMFSVIAYYKNYVLAREERIALACKMAADELHNELMIRLPRYDERDKEKRVALIEAEVESDENIRKWRRRQRKHETFASAHRHERDSIARIVEALSRHETMRHDEWERSGKLSSRRS